MTEKKQTAPASGTPCRAHRLQALCLSVGVRAFMQSEQMHWLWTEVPMMEDVKDYRSKLTDDEREFLTKILRFFTQGDIDVSGAT